MSHSVDIFGITRPTNHFRNCRNWQADGSLHEGDGQVQRTRPAPRFSPRNEDSFSRYERQTREGNTAFRLFAECIVIVTSSRNKHSQQLRVEKTSRSQVRIAYPGRKFLETAWVKDRLWQYENRVLAADGNNQPQYHFQRSLVLQFFREGSHVILCTSR